MGWEGLCTPSFIGDHDLPGLEKPEGTRPDMDMDPSAVYVLDLMKIAEDLISVILIVPDLCLKSEHGLELEKKQLLGHLFNFALMGVLSVQIYVYYLSFKKDPVYIKLLVYTVLLVDLLETGFATHYGCRWLGKPRRFADDAVDARDSTGFIWAYRMARSVVLCVEDYGVGEEEEDV
ncbi:hypothetical protein PQX77_004141 [Marasmius sp. AFHP31]|nr:hypothetical protein PQX77_004141 [Marasmius sp. AFHP31]